MMKTGNHVYNSPTKEDNKESEIKEPCEDISTRVWPDLLCHEYRARFKIVPGVAELPPIKFINAAAGKHYLLTNVDVGFDERTPMCRFKKVFNTTWLKLTINNRVYADQPVSSIWHLSNSLRQFCTSPSTSLPLIIRPEDTIVVTLYRQLPEKEIRKSVHGIVKLSGCMVHPRSADNVAGEPAVI